MQSFQKPENALKRANELLSVGQQDAALKILHGAIGHRRFRSQGWDSVQETIMIRHVQLCVDENKLRLARDGLHQYRIISQHANIQSLGKVIAELRSRAEQKLSQAKEAASVVPASPKEGEAVLAVGASGLGDLDLIADSPEDLLLSTLQIEVRSAEARGIHQALRSVWDVYKMILDLLRTTPKLERVYHETARKAFLFCKENQRPQEFKRLCDVLRSHFALILKNRHKEDYESLMRPDLHLETRMQQLVVASDLELWRECFATAEDLYSLGLHDYFFKTLRTGQDLFHRSREKLMRWLAIYYEKLSRVTWVAENYLFHALAWIKLLLHVKGFKKNASQEDLQAMASVAVLAVLSIPITGAEKKQGDDALTMGEGTQFGSLEQQKKLTMLLGHSTLPTREGLKAVLYTKDLVSLADENCQQLMSLIESEFTPLKLCSLCQPLLDAVSQNPLLEPYVYPLKRVIFHKLIFQLSRVYATLSIKHFTTHICTSSFLPWSQAEKLFVALVQQHQGAAAGGAMAFGSGAGGAHAGANAGAMSLSIRLDYASSAILFETPDAAAANTLRHQLCSLAKQIDKAVHMICPGQSMEERMDRKRFLQELPTRLEAETKRMAERTRATHSRRLEKQEEQQKMEEERRRKEAEQRRVEEKQERERREEATRRREERRMQQEKIKQRSETAAQMLEEIKKIGGKASSTILIKGKQLGDINIDDVLQGNVDYDDLEKAQMAQLNQERITRLRQRRQNYRRVCHFIRACREEELPLLIRWQEEQLARDTQILLAMQNRHEEEHKAAFEAALEEKQIFEVVKGDKESWVSERLAERQQEFEKQAEEQRARLVAVLRQAKLQRARARKEEHVKKLKIEAERKRMEEEQKKYLEQMEKKKQEEEAKAKRLAEQAEKQRQRELEIEEKQRQLDREASSMMRNGAFAAAASPKGPQGAAPTPAAEASPAAEAADSWRRGGDRGAEAASRRRAPGAGASGGGASGRDEDFERWREGKLANAAPEGDAERASGRPRIRVASSALSEHLAGGRGGPERREEAHKAHNGDARQEAPAEDDEGFTTVSRGRRKKKGCLGVLRVSHQQEVDVPAESLFASERRASSEKRTSRAEERGESCQVQSATATASERRSCQNSACPLIRSRLPQQKPVALLGSLFARDFNVLLTTSEGLKAPVSSSLCPSRGTAE
ncbi:putative eukaryotic initiation factor-3 subunit 10 [Besnoitia besnoiti]|uniref:Putative eukaryotic initiation factor-3 subunit 10 n=1 Tax=Besnoitia besnoiti TaxID=94643 RepID=A0A2A9M6E2_BESBE|nr:putative eukaryotic initiation factor-3 subunit 10 [Besnoitia besnoiti]PFH32754.1 putative eukaryotic initiation factor-3 subunit 10 [Besnoitia besnoiti]